MSQIKLFIPVICYNHTANTEYMMSLIRLVLDLKEKGISATLYPIFFESLIGRARNSAASAFVESDCTHMIFIDADIEFAVDDVYRLVSLETDVVCGAYAQKWLSEDKARKAFAMDSNIADPFQLCTVIPGQPFTTPRCENVIEVEYAPTGFMCFRKAVFQKLIENYPEREYVNDIDGYAGINKCYEFFPTIINPITKRLESEDFGFASLWRGCGGSIKMITTLNLKHWGWFGYKANMYRQGVLGI